MKIISWNLLRLTGAAVDDVAALARHEKPDVLLMQEATKKEMEELPSLLGGHFHRLSWLGRIHGLAVWSPHRFAAPRALSLPASRLPGRLPRRRAQIVQVGEMIFANAISATASCSTAASLRASLRRCAASRRPSSATSTSWGL